MSNNPVEIKIPDHTDRLFLFGGPYSNFSATEALLELTKHEAYRFCLGDIGGFGPHPNRTLEAIRRAQVVAIQGNYDHAIGHGEADCGCGYLDPLDRRYAQLSFDYTLKNTSDEHRAWLRGLPAQMILLWRGSRILLCHGSPVETNEFVWQSEASDEKIRNWLTQFKVDGICATHSGLPWFREIAGNGFWFNVGVIGRPAHEGKRHVYYGTLDFESSAFKSPRPNLHRLEYDPTEVIECMRSEKLPEEFCQALDKGIWTTCYNILPAAEAAVQSRGVV